MTANLSPNNKPCRERVNNILKRLQTEADLDLLPTLSGHSFRVGRVLGLLDEGEPVPEFILRSGRSAESTVMHHLRARKL